MRCLSSGNNSASTSIPICLPIASAVRRLSPVSMTVRMPASVSSLSPLFASGRGSSRIAIAPAIVPSIVTRETVLPSSFRAAIFVSCSVVSVQVSATALGDPKNTSTPSTLARTPFPPIAFEPEVAGNEIFCSVALAKIAVASG